jgi:DNA polymerase III delta subunit
VDEELNTYDIAQDATQLIADRLATLGIRIKTDIFERICNDIETVLDMLEMDGELNARP